jgi:hypothetical protein
VPGEGGQAKTLVLSGCPADSQKRELDALNSSWFSKQFVVKALIYMR